MFKPTYTILLTGLLLFSCSDAADETSSDEPKQQEMDQKDNTNPKDEGESDATEMQEQELTSDKYEEGWEVFKTAILMNDTKTLSTMCNLDQVDVQTLVDSFDDPDFRAALEKGTFEDLELDEYEETPTYVFSATVSGDDGEGNIMESGLYLYFLKKDSGLFLENFLAAG